MSTKHSWTRIGEKGPFRALDFLINQECPQTISASSLLETFPWFPRPFLASASTNRMLSRLLNTARWPLPGPLATGGGGGIRPTPGPLVGPYHLLFPPPQSDGRENSGSLVLRVWGGRFSEHLLVIFFLLIAGVQAGPGVAGSFAWAPTPRDRQLPAFHQVPLMKRRHAYRSCARAGAGCRLGASLSWSLFSWEPRACRCPGWRWEASDSRTPA